MTKKIDPRSPAKKAKDAIYKALPVALIEKPLRHIENLFPGEFIANLRGGAPTWRHSWQYLRAERAARGGKGAIVRNIARAGLAAAVGA